MSSDSCVEVRESQVEGLGIFAKRSIPRGAVIRQVVVIREVSAKHPLCPENGECLEHCAHFDGKTFLYGSPDRHMNHSCDPNAFYDHSRKPPLTRAIRDIVVGEEILVDYLINNAGGNTWPCSCGSSRCRGQTGSSFFELPRSLQKEYFPLLAPWFREKFSDRLKEVACGT